MILIVSRVPISRDYTAEEERLIGDAAAAGKYGDKRVRNSCEREFLPCLFRRRGKIAV